MVSPTAYVDPRVVRTRTLLFDAFTELMGEKGFDEISVSDITTRATVNRATFYAHFTDKRALVELLISGGFVQVASARMSAEPPDLAHCLGHLLLAVLDYWSAVDTQCGGAVDPVFESLVERSVLAHTRQLLQNWMSCRDHPVAYRSHPDLVTTMTCAALQAAVLARRALPTPPSPERFALEVLPALLRLVGSEI